MRWRSLEVLNINLVRGDMSWAGIALAKRMDSLTWMGAGRPVKAEMDVTLSFIGGERCWAPIGRLVRIEATP